MTSLSPPPPCHRHLRPCLALGAARRIARRPVPRFVALCLAFFLCVSSRSTPAQTATTLAQVKTIYVDSFGGKLGATELRQRVLDTLGRDAAHGLHPLTVVADRAQADAILKGTGETWVRAYVSINPRRSGNQRPIYSGYLSAQLIGKGPETLWSYLVTPANGAIADVHQDLARQLVHILSDAVRQAASPVPAPVVTLNFAGASFPAPLYQQWIGSFRQRHPGIAIHYQAIGSEAGIEQLRQGRLTFAASDVPLSALPSTGTTANSAAGLPKVFEFATVLGAVVPVYHLPGVSRDLQFTPEILAGIYTGAIRRWNDPLLRAANHGVSLPASEIIVIHRTDGSGTTSAFTSFLSQTVPAWKASVGAGFTVAWPVGLGAAGNDGVAALVERTPDAIGYTELSFAIQRELSYGTVRNPAGRFIQANLLSLAAAAEGAGTLDTALTNAPGKDAYPITSFTWLLIPEAVPDVPTKAAIADFLDWILTTGQKECSALAYTPLPRDIVLREQKLLVTFRAN